MIGEAGEASYIVTAQPMYPCLPIAKFLPWVDHYPFSSNLAAVFKQNDTDLANTVISRIRGFYIDGNEAHDFPLT